MTESAQATNTMAVVTMAECRLVVEMLGGQSMAVAAEPVAAKAVAGEAAIAVAVTVKAAEFLDPQVDFEHAISRRPVMLYAEARPRCKVQGRGPTRVCAEKIVGLLMAFYAIASGCESGRQCRMHSLLEAASPCTSITWSSPA